MRWRLKSRWASEARQGKCHRRMARAALKAKPEGGEAAGAAQAGRWLGGGASGAARSSHRHGVAVRSAWRRSSARHARSCAAQGAQRSLQLVHWARPHRPQHGSATLRALASSTSASCGRGVTRCARVAHAGRWRVRGCTLVAQARGSGAQRVAALQRPPCATLRGAGGAARPCGARKRTPAKSARQGLCAARAAHARIATGRAGRRTLHAGRARCPARPRARTAPAPRPHRASTRAALSSAHTRTHAHLFDGEAQVCVGCVLGWCRAPWALAGGGFQVGAVFHVKHAGAGHAFSVVGGLLSCGSSHSRAASRPAGVRRCRSRCAGRVCGEFWAAARRFCGGGVGGARRVLGATALRTSAPKTRRAQSPRGQPASVCGALRARHTSQPARVSPAPSAPPCQATITRCAGNRCQSGLRTNTKPAPAATAPTLRGRAQRGWLVGQRLRRFPQQPRCPRPLRFGCLRHLRGLCVAPPPQNRRAAPQKSPRPRRAQRERERPAPTGRAAALMCGHRRMATPPPGQARRSTGGLHLARPAGGRRWPHRPPSIDTIDTRSYTRKARVYGLDWPPGRARQRCWAAGRGRALGRAGQRARRVRSA